MHELEIAAISDVGTERDHNEDSCASFRESGASAVVGVFGRLVGREEGLADGDRIEPAADLSRIAADTVSPAERAGEKETRQSVLAWSSARRTARAPHQCRPPTCRT
jgi:hypothetical protein